MDLGELEAHDLAAVEGNHSLSVVEVVVRRDRMGIGVAGTGQSLVRKGFVGLVGVHLEER
jgi:hypothetical protein